MRASIFEQWEQMRNDHWQIIAYSLSIGFTDHVPININNNNNNNNNMNNNTHISLLRWVVASEAVNNANFPA